MISRVLGTIYKSLLPFLNRTERRPEEPRPSASPGQPFAKALALFQSEEYGAAAEAFQVILSDLDRSAGSPVWQETRRYLLLCYIHLDQESEAASLLVSAAAGDGPEPELEDWPQVRDWLRARTSKLRNYWWAALLFIGLLLVVLVTEAIQAVRPGQQGLWWRSALRWLAETWDFLAVNYPVTLLALVVGGLLLIFGARWILFIDDWLAGLWKWSLNHPSVSGAAVVILIIVIFSAVLNANSWSFNNVEIWSEDAFGQTGREVEVIFRANLNGIGNAPLASIPVLDPAAPPTVTRAQESVQQLRLDECQTMLAEPITFAPNPRRNVITIKPLTTVQDSRGTGEPVRLPTAVGTFNLPLDNLTRVLFRYFVPSYRELNAQIIPAPQRAGYIRLIVASTPNEQRWLVEGPREALPEMINFIATRIALDWTYQRTGLASDKIPSHELALALGNQAYLAGDLPQALVYYDLAAFYQAEDPNIQLMRGLSYLQTEFAQGNSEPGVVGVALAAVQKATQLAPSRTTTAPYLACLYFEQGQIELAQSTLETFNSALVEEATRREALASLPVLGQGSRLFVTTNRRDPMTFDVYYLSGDSISYALGWRPDSSPGLSHFKLGDTPRQLYAIENGVFLITSDGLVKFFSPNDGFLSTVISSRDLTFVPTNYSRLPKMDINLASQAGQATPAETRVNMGGVRQIVIDADGQRPVLFALDRFGNVHRLALKLDEARGSYQASSESVLLGAEASQIALEDGTLYFLSKDGTIWQISEAFRGALAPAQLLELTNNQQFAVFGGSVYLLRDDTTISHFRTDAPNRVTQIDSVPGTQRLDVSNSGLFVLKIDGAIWQITNPMAPSYPNDFRLVSGKISGTRLGMFTYQNFVFALDTSPSGELIASFPARSVTPSTVAN
jgi:tetratricopeptide (TPR) repeat protein